MERFVKGDVVVLPFLFSDLSSSKKRPALIVADLQGDDYILAQITSTARHDIYGISLKKTDFKKGNLPVGSIIRPNRLFTADKSIFVYKSGSLIPNKIREVEKFIVHMFTQ